MIEIVIDCFVKCVAVGSGVSRHARMTDDVGIGKYQHNGIVVPGTIGSILFCHQFCSRQFLYRKLNWRDESTVEKLLYLYSLIAIKSFVGVILLGSTIVRR